MKELQYLNKYYFKYKWRLLLGTLFVFASNYFGILIPQKIRESLDFVQEKTRMASEGSISMTQSDLNNTLFIFGISVIGFMVIKGIFMYLMRQTIIVTSRLIEYDMRKEIFLHLETLDNDFYKSSRTGDIMARISEDVSKVRNYLGPAILYGLNLISLFSLTIYSMIKVNSELALYTLIPLPFLSLSIYYVSTLINNKSAIIQKQVSKLNTIAQEVFSGIRVVKSYGKEKEFVNFFEKESEVFKNQSMDLAKINAYFFPLMILLINISTLIVLYVGGKQVASEGLTEGNIAEFIIYVNMLTWPVTSIGWIASIIQEAEASQARINELLKVSNSQSKGNIELKSIEGNIEFKNVSFTYKDTGVVALKNLNFRINKGENIAIVGRTASGKSTIAELLLGMYDVTEGSILIDGINICEIENKSLRRHIGYVPQDVFLFSDTVANNIAFGTMNSDKELIDQYAEFASVKEDILRLPEEYDTIVGERGVSLSGGQKQRISIARAFIKKPDVFILDDCLSAVDTETEQKILNYINLTLKGKTAIVITHRLTSLSAFDKILLLENGEITEEGTHHELMSKEGIYAELFNKTHSVDELTS